MEKHYSIDPGMGQKMEGCPYSTFEDGHDVKDYIIPPKGYEFVEFKLEPLVNNQIYDGKLVAQYTKSSIKERLTTNIWKILVPVIILAVIALIAILVAGVFKDPNPKPTVIEPKKPKNETVAKVTDTVSQTVTTPAKPNDSVVEEDNDVIIDLTQQNTQQAENQTVEEESKQPQPAADDPNVQFKQEFWALIHEGVIMMDPYHDLYVNNKGKVEGEEFDYLRFTILKDYTTFKAWYGKLRKIPASERESIQTVNELVRKLNEIE